MKLKNISKENLFTLVVYAFAFLYLILQEAIYTPDTSSYLKGSIWRSAGYPSFTLVLKLLFKSYFNIATVGFQLVIGFLSVNYFLNKISKAISLHTILSFILLIILLFPFFFPLYVANNICSEGLSYPLYLFFLGFSIDFLYLKNTKVLWMLILSFILLSITRGQFIITIAIIAFIYSLKNRKELLKKQHFLIIIGLIISTLSISFIDKAYHKYRNNVFEVTPFTYIATNGSALYVSKPNDSEDITNKDDKAIFKDCYSFLSDNKWLLSSEERSSNKADYLHFHKNLGNICNYTLHDRGTAYYLNKGFSDIEARIKVEQSAKRIFFVLTKNNMKAYWTLLFNNLLYGLGSVIILIILVVILFLSLFKLLKHYTKEYSLLFFLSSLTLSNAMIVAFASHSIMRYLFYNYSLILLIVVILYKILKREFKS